MDKNSKLVAKASDAEGLQQNTELKVLTQTIICGRQFKVYGTADDPLFLAKDVAEMIEHSQVTRMVESIDDDEKVVNIVHTLGGNQTAWFLTEDGLYEVLMQSRKPIAKQFKKGVKEILKQIRKTGSYVPRTFREALVMALEAEDRRIEAEQKAAMLTEKIVEFAPKVDNYNQFLSIDDSITVSCVAKKFGLSATKLNRILKEEGVQYKPKGRSFWLPKQGYEDWFMVKDVKYDGDTRLTSQTRVSPLGEEKIKEILVRLGYHEQMLLPF